MECPHVSQLATLQPPKLSQSVHREECTQCFDNQDQPHGVDVCLTCFNGGCLSSERHHARTHVSRNPGHVFTLNVRRKLRPSAQRDGDDEPPAKITKLAIAAQTEADQYEHSTFLRCWACDPTNGRELPSSAQSSVTALVNGVLTSMSSARASEVQAWEEELQACEHTLLLAQAPDPSVLNNGVVGTQCNACDLKENLWLCLTCGSLGCGRRQYGGVAGGNGHGVAHFESTGHPISVKLGTITPEGGADIYCYTCNEERINPELAGHLRTFGMNVASQTKTEKSMTELQIEHNLKFDFSLTDESGHALEPVFGPGLTGLSNLGNSCYMASTLQSLFALPAFQSAYNTSVSANHWQSCTASLPADCLTCQLLKISDGLLSGRYSHPRPSALGPPKSTNELAHESPAPVFQEGVRPAAFKALVGKGHAEFSTMRQQDAEEFFSFLVEAIQRDAKRSDASPLAQAGAKATEVFKFGLESRLQCGKCGGVRYKTDGAGVLSVAVPAVEKGKDGEGKTQYEEVRLEQCVGDVFGEEGLEYACSKCGESVHATKGTKLASFPDVLVVHAKKFTLVNWVPAKLEIPVILPTDDILVLDAFLGHGLQAHETALPEDGPSSGAASLPAFNEAAMAQLEGMGFPTIRCQKALLATGNSDAEAAMEWLFAHMEDPDIDAPIQVGAASAAKEPSSEQISMLADMGFTSAQARKALIETDGNAERAVEWLFSHPDDMGLDTSSASRPADTITSTSSENVGGNTTTPAWYRLKAFISHKGPSVHSGHYVAHIRVSPMADADEGWVLFNDEKVVKADAASIRDLRRHAYLYIFERV